MQAKSSKTEIEIARETSNLCHAISTALPNLESIIKDERHIKCKYSERYYSRIQLGKSPIKANCF